MIPSWWLIGLYIVLDLFSHVITPDNGIANMAHLGGYGMGIAVAFFLLGTKILEREPYDLFSIMKHRQRRRAFASATRMHDQQMDRIRSEQSSKAPRDPRAEKIAEARAEVGTLLAKGQHEQAADAYLRMIDELEGHGLTMSHRDKLKRMPRGFEAAADTPIADYLKWKSFFVMKEFDDAAPQSPAFTEHVVEVIEQSLPLLRFGWEIMDDAPVAG